MSELRVNGSSVQLTEGGFLANASDWTPEVARALAREAGIELTDRHWQVIEFCRADFEKNGEPPGVRRITKVGKIPTKEMYALFPGGPGKLAAKLSGLRKPTSCV
jgi:tRNA 2-thiouridine synthesizing protein E